MIYVCTLDEKSKDILDGKDTVISVNELYKVITQSQCSGIVLRKDFVEKFLTPMGVCELVNQIKSLNPRIQVETDVDYWDSQHSDIKLISMLKDKEDFIDWVLSKKDEAFKLYHDLCVEHNEEVDSTMLSISKVNSLNNSCVQLKSLYDQERSKNKYLQDKLNEVLAEHNSLVSKINMSYNLGVDDKSLSGVDIDVNHYQKILYIKEITRVTYVDSFIYYLKEILRTLYTVPSRLLIIEAPYAYNRVDLYPNCKSNLDMSVGDVFRNDIFCAGYSEPLVKDVLKNPSKYPYLIVLDRTGYKKPFIRGKGVETFYTVSDINDVKGMVDLRHIISYNKNTLHINYMDDFIGKSKQEKISLYSSMAIMKYTIDLLEGNDVDGK